MNRRDFFKKTGLVLSGIFAAATLGMADAGQAAAQQQDLPGNQTTINYKHQTLSSTSMDKVGARLVCLFDASGSIDYSEYEIQIESMADAIESEDFRDAVFFQSGPESIAICFADFASSSEMRIPWVDIRKGEDYKFKALADELRKLPRREQGSTNHTAAFNTAAQALENCPWEADKSIVDIMTDGKANTEEAGLPAAYNNLVINHDATINALVTITSQEPDLEEWARNNLITQPGFSKADGTLIDAGFVKVVANQRGYSSYYGPGYGGGYGGDEGSTKKYEHAMRWAFQRKLVLEVAGIELDDLRKTMGRKPAPTPGSAKT